jgi:hypothetical protein
MSEPAKIVSVSALTTYEVEPHSALVHLNIRQSNGAPASLVLPVDCLSQLLMTIPRMVAEALRESRGDETARLVYPLATHRLEVADQRVHGEQQFILTLETSESFAVSFCASADLLTCIAHSIVGDLATSPVVEQRPKVLS